MEQIFLTAAVLLLPMLCTTAGAAGVFLLRKTGEPATRRMLCGMAAGIMLAASVWSLLLPAIERAEQGPLPAWVPPAVGLLLGAVGLLRLETLAGRLLNAGPGRCGRMVLAVTLHNLPEGMVVGLAAALALRGEPDAISGALALALGIGLQNIPEGAAVSLPLAQELLFLSIHCCYDHSFPLCCKAQMTNRKNGHKAPCFSVAAKAARKTA